MEAKILVVGPINATTRFIAQHLENRGFDARTLFDSGEAMGTMAQGGTRIVFVDVDEPQLDGLGLIKAIRDFDGTIQVIATTRSSRLLKAVQAFKLGASDYILAPEKNPDRIDHAIWLCLEKFKWWSGIFRQITRPGKAAAKPRPDRNDG